MDNSWAFQHAREPQNSRWFVGYCVCMLATMVTGLTAWNNMSPVFSKIVSNSSYVDNPANCHAGPGGMRSLAQSDGDEELDELFHSAWKWIIASVFLAMAGGLLLIHLFRIVPFGMITLSFVLPVVYLLIMAAIHPSPALIAVSLLLGGLIAALYFWRKEKLKLVARVMRVAAESVRENMALLPFTAAVSIILLVPLLFFGASLYGVFANGDLVPNPKATGSGGIIGCKGEDGTYETCCTWQPKGWSWPAGAFLTVMLMWTTAILGQLRTFVIGGTITQWYFQSATRGAIWVSLRHALGPHRGSLCLSAAVITACNILRSVVRYIRDKCRQGLIGWILMCLLSWLVNLITMVIQAISDFATVQMAATGEGFMDATRSVCQLLQRNSMDAFRVWWLPNFTLSMLVLFVSAGWGVSVGYVAGSVWESHHRLNVTLDAIILGGVVYVTWMVVLGWVAGVLKSCTDAVYICYARDRDRRSVTRPEIHTVYKDLPAPSGAVVLQPDDNIVYGAMEDGTASLPPDSPAPAELQQVAASHTDDIEGRLVQLPKL